jgi:Uma2 family endonuclease
MDTVTTLPHGRPLTQADLESMPDDGHRYELIDGALIVTPSSSWQHQRVGFSLAVLLREHCPEGLEVFMAPLDVVLSHDTVMEPDVLIARQSDLGARDLPAVPVLAVEVLSPSTRHIDLMLKRSRFEAAGCPSYWVVDPIELVLTAWELNDGVYTEIARVRGDEEFKASRPFPVVVRPAALFDR